MTTQEFITAVEAKPNFLKWAQNPTVARTVGDVELHEGIALITTADGRNLFNVFFVVDIATGEATWQNGDTMEPEENTLAKKQQALANYLKSNFAAYFVNRADLDNNWAEADVYAVSGQDLAKSTVVVYKIGAQPITHKTVV